MMLLMNLALVLQEVPDPINYTKQLWDISPVIGAICTPLIAIIVYFVIENRSRGKKHDTQIATLQKQSEDRIKDAKERIAEKDRTLLRIYDERRDDERHTLEVLMSLNMLTKQIVTSGKEHTERVLEAIRGLDKSVTEFKNTIITRP